MNDHDWVRLTIQQWLSKANDDWETVRHHLETGFDRHWVTAFHAQQAAEKYLKALLVHHQIHFARTHEISELLAHVQQIDSALARQLAPAAALTSYAVADRYPTPNPAKPTIVTRGDAVAAAELAREVRDAVLQRLQQYVEPTS